MLHLCFTYVFPFSLFFHALAGWRAGWAGWLAGLRMAGWPGSLAGWLAGWVGLPTYTFSENLGRLKPLLKGPIRRSNFAILRPNANLGFWPSKIIDLEFCQHFMLHLCFTYASLMLHLCFSVFFDFPCIFFWIFQHFMLHLCFTYASRMLHL